MHRLKAIRYRRALGALCVGLVTGSVVYAATRPTQHNWATWFGPWELPAGAGGEPRRVSVEARGVTWRWRGRTEQPPQSDTPLTIWRSWRILLSLEAGGGTGLFGPPVPVDRLSPGERQVLAGLVGDRQVRGMIAGGQAAARWVRWGLLLPYAGLLIACGLLGAGAVLSGPAVWERILLGWRGDGVRRCVRCGYPLVGLARGRCPECGTTGEEPAAPGGTRSG